MSDSDREENEKEEKPYPKDSQVQGEEEEDFPNKENDINNNDDNHFPEEEYDNENGKKQSINNSNIENDKNDFNNSIDKNGQENQNNDIQDNTFPSKEENNNSDLIDHENQENNNKNVDINNINIKSSQKKNNDLNQENTFNYENEENNKENSFRFSKEHDSKDPNQGALNMKDNEFEYEDDNKNQNENNNKNDSFGFGDSNIKDNNSLNFNNNQYDNNFNNKGENQNNYNIKNRNSSNSDNMPINNINNNNEPENKFNSFNPYDDNNNLKNSTNNNFNYAKNPYTSNNNSNNNNFNYIKNPYTSNDNSNKNNTFNNNYNNNKYNNNYKNNNYNNNYNNNNYNNNYNNKSYNNNYNNNNYNNKYSPSSNQNQNQTTAGFIPQEVPITNNLNYNYSSSYPPHSSSKNPDYDPYYERFEQYPEDSDGFDIDPSKSGKDSSTTAGIQIANTIMGAGILSIPLVFSYLGILIGTVLLLFMAVSTIYSVYILMRCHQITGKSGYSMFGKITMGTIGSILVKVIIIINNMGICICYLRIFGEVFQTILQSFISKNSFLMTNWHNWIWILLGAVIMFFFIFIKNISSLKKVSYLGVIAVLAFTILMTVLLLYKTIASELDSDVDWTFLFPNCTFPQAFHAAPTIFLAFLFQFNVFPIYYSLQHRNMKSMFRATKIGVILSLIIFFVVGIVGFLLYGFFDNYDDENFEEVYDTQNNNTATYDTILDKLNDDMILYKGYNIFVVILIIIICVAFVVTCLASFPILFLSLRVNYINSLEVCRRAKNGDTQQVQIIQGNYEKRGTRISKKALIIITIILYLFMVAIAILVYNLKSLFQVIGAIAGTFIAFILPNIFYIRIVKISGKNYSLVLPFIILAIGILFFVFSIIMAFFDN